ncbi:MAG: glutathione S-transferase family protein [Gammaproteobacteria bacterium]|nr:glutathione S-transferase family protein [Gammaproteobacteria bacterium]
MSDLFEFGRAADPDASSGYGATGDMKKTQYVLQLLGSPGDAGTLKCLITAVEMGMETDCGILDISVNEQHSSAYLEVSPYGTIPALKEADYIVAGEQGIMSYIEARGLGRRLPPQNAALLAAQNYWSDVACSEVGLHVEEIVKQRVYAPILGKDPDHTAVDRAREGLEAALDALDEQLANNEFIIGSYSFADIHWTAYIHLLCEAGEGAVVDQRPNIKAWLDRIRAHKSYSGQNIIAYDLLPTREDIKNKRLSSVEVSDY